VNWLNLPPRDFGFPQINVSGFSPVGDQTQLPIARHTNTYQLAESFSTTHGPHTLKASGEICHIPFARHAGLFRARLPDVLRRHYRERPQRPAGRPASFGIQASFDNPQSLGTTAYDVWLQDDWKALPTLTISLGVRYEYNTPPRDPHDRMSVFDPRTGAIANVGTQGIPRAGIRPTATTSRRARDSLGCLPASSWCAADTESITKPACWW
jgi:outer membrane receptor protein involved in Fe transport